MRKILPGIVLSVALLLGACGPLSPDLIFGDQESAVQTMVAATMLPLSLTPQPTHTASLTPSITPSPQNTPRPTTTDIPTMTPAPSLTPLIAPSATLFVAASNTPSEGGPGSSGIQRSGEYACQVLSSSPILRKMKGGTQFNGVWDIKNEGQTVWFSSEVELVFIEGNDNMVTTPEFFFISRDVYPGNTFTVTIEMKAPGADKTHSATWGLRRGGNIFCEFTASIITIIE